MDLAVQVKNRDMKIGDTIEKNGITYKLVPEGVGDRCAGCTFRNVGCPDWNSSPDGALCAKGIWHIVNSVRPSLSPLDVQIGGAHYKERGVQPIEFVERNKLTFSEGCVVKYITRWRDKNGKEDLEKILHYVDFIRHFGHHKARVYTWEITVFEYIRSNNLNYFEGNVISKLCSWINTGEEKHLDYIVTSVKELMKDA